MYAPDGLVARRKSSAWTFYTFDQQGNVAQRLTSTQAVSSSSIYDAYGAESSNSTPTDVFGYNARWGYRLDRETGLYLCQHRYYNPSTGRWLTRDPIGFRGGVSHYAYAQNRPNFAADPSGEAIVNIPRITFRLQNIIQILLSYQVLKYRSL